MVKRMSRLISQLQDMVLVRLQVVAERTREQHRLRMRTMVAALLLQQCSALLELGQALQRGRAAAAAAGSSSSGSGSGGCSSSGRSPGTLPYWQASVLQLKSQLEAVSAQVNEEPATADQAGTSAPSARPGEIAPTAAEAGPDDAPGPTTPAATGRGGSLSAGPFPLNWLPEAVAEAHLAERPDLSSARMRATVLEFARLSGTLLP